MSDPKTHDPTDALTAPAENPDDTAIRQRLAALRAELEEVEAEVAGDVAPKGSHRSPGLYPIGADGEGYPMYERTGLDERLDDLIEEYRKRGIGCANRNHILISDALGALLSPEYHDLYETLESVLRDLYSRARTRTLFLAGVEFQCDFCGDILRTTSAGDHFADRHGATS